MDKSAATWGAFFGFFGVLLGAFASHWLKEVLSPSQLDTFETGIKYQLYHAFLLLFLSLQKFLKPITLTLVNYLVVAGVLLFSGSIYILSFKNVLEFTPGFVVFLTPIGGSSLLLAWLILLINLIKQKSTNI